MSKASDLITSLAFLLGFGLFVKGVLTVVRIVGDLISHYFWDNLV